jgi:hypothetical protein
VEKDSKDILVTSAFIALLFGCCSAIFSYGSAIIGCYPASARHLFLFCLPVSPQFNSNFSPFHLQLFSALFIFLYAGRPPPNPLSQFRFKL